MSRSSGGVGGGVDSHQWRTLQMFLEQSGASCWNVFPLHEDTGTATLLAVPAGSCDRGHVTERSLTSRRSSQPGPAHAGAGR